MKNRWIAKEWRNIIILMVVSVLVTIILLYQIVQQTSESVREETTDHIVEIAETGKKECGHAYKGYVGYDAECRRDA